MIHQLQINQKHALSSPQKVELKVSLVTFRKIQLHRQDIQQTWENSRTTQFQWCIPIPRYISNYAAHSNACESISQLRCPMSKLKFQCVCDTNKDDLKFFQIISCPPGFCSCSSCSFCHRDFCFDFCHSSCSLTPCSWIASYLCCGTSSCLSFSWSDWGRQTCCNT